MQYWVAYKADGSAWTWGSGQAGVSSVPTQVMDTGVVSKLNFVPGWNLVGNGSNMPVNVAYLLGDQTRVKSVWKWIPASATWAFYSPSFIDGGAAYAVTKGYLPLTTIQGGEGFWVNATQTFSKDLATGGAMLQSSVFQAQGGQGSKALGAGWSLISTGNSSSVYQFRDAVNGGFTSLWAWDASMTSWYFYASALDASGALQDYLASKGYLDFTARNKTLGPAVGFWVNVPDSMLAACLTSPIKNK